MNKPLRVGVLGVGHLMFHVIPGLLRGVNKPEILLGTRNAERAKQLSERFGLQISPSNEHLVEHSDVVIVAVRPFQVEEVVCNLPWRADQHVLSFAATVGSNAYRPHVNGASVSLAMPVVAAEYGESPTCLFPDNALMRKLLEPCGPVIALEKEQDFGAASVFGAYYGWVQALVKTTSEWAHTNGLSQESARALVAGMTRAGATTVLERAETPLGDLIDELCLPGSLTGEGIDILDEQSAFSPWHSALEAIHRRIND